MENSRMIKAGLFGFSYGNSFIAKAIRLFQTGYLWAIGETINKPMPNHMFFTFSDKHGEIYIMEMNPSSLKDLKKANKVTKWEDSEYYKNGNYYLKQINPGWSKRELLCWNILASFKAKKRIPYDYVNTIGHEAIKMLDAIIDRIKNGGINPLWIGKKGIGATGLMMCSEFVFTFTNEVIHNTAERQKITDTPHSDSPLDGFLNKNLIDYEK